MPFHAPLLTCLEHCRGGRLAEAHVGMLFYAPLPVHALRTPDTRLTHALYTPYTRFTHHTPYTSLTHTSHTPYTRFTHHTPYTSLTHTSHMPYTRFTHHTPYTSLTHTSHTPYTSLTHALHTPYTHLTHALHTTHLTHALRTPYTRLTHPLLTPYARFTHTLHMLYTPLPIYALQTDKLQNSFMQNDCGRVIQSFPVWRTLSSHCGMSGPCKAWGYRNPERSWYQHRWPGTPKYAAHDRTFTDFAANPRL